MTSGPEQQGSPWAKTMSRPLLDEMERRWNCHEPMLAALKELLARDADVYGDAEAEGYAAPDWIVNARAAVAKAEGK